MAYPPSDDDLTSAKTTIVNILKMEGYKLDSGSLFLAFKDAGGEMSQFAPSLEELQNENIIKSDSEGNIPDSVSSGLNEAVNIVITDDVTFAKGKIIEDATNSGTITYNISDTATNLAAGIGTDSVAITSAGTVTASTSATAAPVPYPSASKPVSNFISSNFPFSLILNSLFGSAILFIKTSS